MLSCMYICNFSVLCVSLKQHKYIACSFFVCNLYLSAVTLLSGLRSFVSVGVLVRLIRKCAMMLEYSVLIICCSVIAGKKANLDMISESGTVWRRTCLVSRGRCSCVVSAAC